MTEKTTPPHDELRTRYPLQLGATNATLRTMCDEVTIFDDELVQLVDDMLRLPQIYDGIGIAAPQIGITKRVAIVSVFDDAEQEIVRTHAIINPVITKRGLKMVSREEGCLSLPGVNDIVTRPDDIRYTYQDAHGDTHEAHVTGLSATVVQHEIDHLDGVLFIDKVG